MYFNYNYLHVGWTPLISAASAGHLPSIKLLLGKNASVAEFTDNHRYI